MRRRPVAVDVGSGRLDGGEIGGRALGCGVGAGGSEDVPHCPTPTPTVRTSPHLPAAVAPALAHSRQAVKMTLSGAGRGKGQETHEAEEVRGTESAGWMQAHIPA